MTSGGNQISYTDTLGFVWKQSFDLIDQMKESIDKDAIGRTEKKSYDIARRLIASVSNSVETIRYDYDKLDDLLSKRYENLKTATASQLERESKEDETGYLNTEKIILENYILINKHKNIFSPPLQIYLQRERTTYR